MDSGAVSYPLSEKDRKGSGSPALAPLKTYTKRFEEVFPFYLSIGMTADEFWNQDSTLVKFYRRADELRKKRKNEELWLQGLYVYQAIMRAAPILHAFAKPGTKAYPYLDKPIPLTEEEAKRREEAERIARFENMRAIMFAKAQQAKNKKA